MIWTQKRWRGQYEAKYCERQPPIWPPRIISDSRQTNRACDPIVIIHHRILVGRLKQAGAAEIPRFLSPPPPPPASPPACTPRCAPSPRAPSARHCQPTSQPSSSGLPLWPSRTGIRVRLARDLSRSEFGGVRVRGVRPDSLRSYMSCGPICGTHIGPQPKYAGTTVTPGRGPRGPRPAGGAICRHHVRFEFGTDAQGPGSAPARTLESRLG